MRRRVCVCVHRHTPAPLALGSSALQRCQGPRWQGCMAEHAAARTWARLGGTRLCHNRCAVGSQPARKQVASTCLCCSQNALAVLLSSSWWRCFPHAVVLLAERCPGSATCTAQAVRPCLASSAVPCSHWEHPLSAHVHICTHILQEHSGLSSPLGNLVLAQTFYNQTREDTGTECSQFTSSAGSTSLLATCKAPFWQAVPMGWVERGEAEGENQKPRASLTELRTAPHREAQEAPKEQGWALLARGWSPGGQQGQRATTQLLSVGEVPLHQPPLTKPTLLS